MSEQLRMFLRSVEEFDSRMAEVDTQDMGNATPCTEWNVRDLINHLVSEDRWVSPLLAGKTIDEVGDSLDGDLVGDDPHLAWKLASEEATNAAREEGATERTVHLSFGDFPGGDYLDQLTADHVIHAWDLARGASGNDVLDEELMRYVYGWAAPIEEVLKGSGSYGDKIESHQDADLQTKLLAVFGRRA